MPLALILGGGPRIGFATARAFKKDGYEVVLGSRNPDKQKAETEGFHTISLDLTKTDSVENTFKVISDTIAIPNVVVYNAAMLSFDPDDPFAVSNETFLNDLHLNLIAAYASLRAATRGFQKLSAEDPKVFIATGNVLPFQAAMSRGVTLGPGKSGLVYLIEIGATSYEKQGYRFYFASQVTDDDGPVPYESVDGPAHGKVYAELVKQNVQGKWDVRFRADGTIVNK